MASNNFGQCKLNCSDKYMQDNFERVKSTALSYALHDGDGVGLWYEAALPERDSFCIRDLSHQRSGAAVLGLNEHTFNMFKKFASSMASSRDYCMYWEIDKSGNPTAVDYTDDGDFWYNLPAPFDMLFACYSEYLWTGDDRYLTDEAFLNFYDKTFSKFIDVWDKDRDGIPEHYPHYGRRGIASYYEQGEFSFIGGDLIGAMYAAYKAYSAILLSGKEYERADSMQKHADRMKEIYLAEWFDNASKEFYGSMSAQKRFSKEYKYESNFLPIYFGILDGSTLKECAVEQLKRNMPKNVEALTYMPKIFYDAGRYQECLTALKTLLSPSLDRKEYPEVSYLAIAGIVNYYLGLDVTGTNAISVMQRFQGEHIELNKLPIFNTELSIRHNDKKSTIITSSSDKPICCRFGFEGKHSKIFINGIPHTPRLSTDENGNVASFVDTVLSCGQTTAKTE